MEQPTFAIILAEDEPSAPAKPTQPPPWFDLVFLWAPLLLLIFFFMFRSSRRQEQQRLMLLNSMKKNDEVLTHAGIYGKIVSVSESEDKVILEIDDKVRIKVTKNAIARNLTNEQDAVKAAQQAKQQKTA